MCRQTWFSVYVFSLVVAFQCFGSAALADKPIPCGKNAPTEAKWRDELFAHRRAELDVYKKLTKDSPTIQTAVLDFSQGYLRATFGKSDVPTWESLKTQGEQLSARGERPVLLVDAGCGHVGVWPIRKRTGDDHAAFDEISSAEYPTAIKLRVRPGTANRAENRRRKRPLAIQHDSSAAIDPSTTRGDRGSAE